MMARASAPHHMTDRANFPIAVYPPVNERNRAFMSTPRFSLSRVMCALAASFMLAIGAVAQSEIPPTDLPLDSLVNFRAPTANWQTARGLGGDPRIEKLLTALPGTGILVNNPTPAARGHLFTAWEHGDLELDLDFLMTAGSNSGVYLMGRYEVQLFDSWGVKVPTVADCGSIYERWDGARGKGREGYEGVAPRANASRAPGLWQHLHIEFQAPRFDATGRKIANARFIKVALNDFVIHENVEVTGPTRSAAFTDEGPLGPLMIQGDHGSVALRAITYKRFDQAARLSVDDLTYKLYTTMPREKMGDYEATVPTGSGSVRQFSGEEVPPSGKFVIVYTGTLVVPIAGTYAFQAAADRGADPVTVLVDGHPVVEPIQSGGYTRPLVLTAGRHSIRLDYMHGSNRKSGFKLTAEGPSVARRELSAPKSTKLAGAKSAPEPVSEILIEPAADRVRLQRSFVPFTPKKHLYAINVGTPDGLHYAYDFETAAMLRVWRGKFLDTFEVWDGRGENQLAKPAGPALTLSAKPVLALIESSAHDWPDQPDPLWSSQGYQLEPNGQPIFHFTLATLRATDRIAPATATHGLTRTLLITGKKTDWESWVLLAEAEQITPQPNGRGYIIGDRAYYLDLPAQSPVRPFVRTRYGRQQLVAPITKATLDQPIVYTLVW